MAHWRVYFTHKLYAQIFQQFARRVRRIKERCRHRRSVVQQILQVRARAAVRLAEEAVIYTLTP